MAKSADAFRTISEVAEWLDTPAHVLRFWESRFTQVKPVKRAGGRRYFRPADMELLGGIKKLLHEDGMTIKGVQKKLKTDGVKSVAALSQAVIPPSDAVINAKEDVALETSKPEISEPQTPVETPLSAETPPADVPVASPPVRTPELVPAAPVAPTPAEPATFDPVKDLNVSAEAQAPIASAPSEPAATAPTLPVPEAPTPVDPTPVEQAIPDPAKDLDASVEAKAPTVSTPAAPVPSEDSLEPEDEADTWLDPQELPSASEIEVALAPSKPVADTVEAIPVAVAEDISLEADETPAAEIPDVTPSEPSVLKPDVITVPDDLADDAELEAPSNMVAQIRAGKLNGNIADLQTQSDRLTALHARLKASITPNPLG